MKNDCDFESFFCWHILRTLPLLGLLALSLTLRARADNCDVAAWLDNLRIDRGAAAGSALMRLSPGTHSVGLVGRTLCYGKTCSYLLVVHLGGNARIDNSSIHLAASAWAGRDERHDIRDLPGPTSGEAHAYASDFVWCNEFLTETEWAEAVATGYIITTPSVVCLGFSCFIDGLQNPCWHEGADAYYGGSCVFTISNEVTVTWEQYSDLGSGSVIGVVTTNFPVHLPNSTDSNAPIGCNWVPLYVWTNAPCGEWFAVPTFGPRVQFTMRGDSVFKEIANFPSGSTFLLEVGGVTHGPFTNGQSFSFAHDAGRGATQFTMFAQTNTVLPLRPVQLVFDTPFADFEAQVSAPSLVHIRFRRLDDGVPDSGLGPDTLTYGESVALDALVSGSCSNRFQWWHEGLPLPGETNATLTLSNITLAMSGRYWIGVNNELGDQAGAAMHLVVSSPVVQLLAPRLVGNAFQATLNGVPVGTEFLVESSEDLFQWQPARTNTVAATNFLFTMPISGSGSARFYRLRLK
jgi:hypothetical protein